MNGLRDLGDQLKEKLGEGVVVLAAVNDGKVNVLAMATDAAQKAGAHAGNLDKSCGCYCWRRRWRTSEYGPGRRTVILKKQMRLLQQQLVFWKDS